MLTSHFPHAENDDGDDDSDDDDSFEMTTFNKSHVQYIQKLNEQRNLFLIL